MHSTETCWQTDKRQPFFNRISKLIFEQKYLYVYLVQKYATGSQQGGFGPMGGEEREKYNKITKTDEVIVLNQEVLGLFCKTVLL